MKVPHPSSLALWIALLAGALLPGRVRAQDPDAPPVHYRVGSIDPRSRTVRVECAPGVTGDLTFALPRWVPGNYERVPLRRYLSDLHLRLRDGRESPITEDPTTWTWRAQVPTGERATFSYTVRAYETQASRGLTQLYVGPDGAFLLPAACFVYLRGQERRACRLKLDLPAGWKAALPLPLSGEAFAAQSFEELGDSPVEMGRPAGTGLSLSPAQAAGRPLSLAVTGRPGAAPQTIEAVARGALEANTALFGDVPFPDYTMGLHAGRGASDSLAGLEHARAATMAFDSAAPLEDDYLKGEGASLVYHETFHAWDVKAMRPAEFVPYRLDRLPRCRTLWFAEGFANYYGALLPVRSGWWRTPELLYEDMADAYGAYASSSGRRRTSLSRASEITFDDRNYGEGDGTSYYTKGQLAALLLDMDLRRATAGARTLDDVMRWVYRRYPASRGGYPDGFLPGAIRQATGVDLDRECRWYVDTAEDLPMTDRLAVVGLRLVAERGSWRIVEDENADASARRQREAWLRGAAAERALAPAFGPRSSPADPAFAGWSWFSPRRRTW